MLVSGLICMQRYLIITSWVNEADSSVSRTLTGLILILDPRLHKLGLSERMGPHVGPKPAGRAVGVQCLDIRAAVKSWRLWQSDAQLTQLASWNIIRKWGARNTGWVLPSKASSLHVLCGLGEAVSCILSDVLWGYFRRTECRTCGHGFCSSFLETEWSFLLRYNRLPSVTLQDQRLSYVDRSLL